MARTSIFVVLVVVLAVQTIVQGLDEAQKKECVKYTKRTLKKVLKSFNACNDKLKLHKVSAEEYQKKIGCVVKCVMQTVEVLDADGKMTEATLKSAIESHLPADFIPHAHEILMGCVTEHGAKLDNSDENCKSYMEMGTCMQGAVAEACGEVPMI